MSAIQAWSSDGKKFLAQDVHNKLYIVEQENINGYQFLTQLSDGQNSHFCWSWDDEKIYYYNQLIIHDGSKRIKIKEVNCIDVYNGKIDHNIPTSFNGIRNYASAKDLEDVIVYTNSETLNIEARKFNSDSSWVIIPKGHYIPIFLTPDRQKILMKDGFVHLNGERKCSYRLKTGLVKQLV